MGGLFVCLDCMTVHDDFSGEKRSMDVDTAGGFLIARTYCKVCNYLMQGCDPENPNIQCGRCGTRYRWEVDGENGFRFLMAPAGAKLLQRCKDRMGIA